MRKITIGIIGFGIVGRAIQHGFQQLCDFRIYDKNPDISENTLKEVCEDSEFIFICVPTPMDEETGSQDTSIVEDVIEECSLYTYGTDKILIIKSTVAPGTTYNLEFKHPSCNIVFNPEFLTERSYKLDFINTSRIILGGHLDNTKKVEGLYRLRFPDNSVPIFHTNFITAEIVKCLANCFLASKVAIFNEYYQICKSLDIDYNEVVGMILADGRIGRSHTQVPGHDGQLGFGGKCFPKDLNATINTAKFYNVEPTIMEAVWKKNLEVRKEKDWKNIKGAVSKNEKKNKKR